MVEKFEIADLMKEIWKEKVCACCLRLDYAAAGYRA